MNAQDSDYRLAVSMAVCLYAQPYAVVVVLLEHKAVNAYGVFHSTSEITVGNHGTSNVMAVVAISVVAAFDCYSLSFGYCHCRVSFSG